MNNKKSKRTHSDVSDCTSSDSEQEYIQKNINKENFPRFLVIEILGEKKTSELSPFLIEKVISQNSKPKMVKKMKNGNLLITVDNYKDAKNILEMEKFHTYECKTFAHERLNYSKGIIRSHDLTLATKDEIKNALKKQGVIDHNRIYIKKNGQSIPTRTYVLTFNTPKAPKEIKIGYINEKVEPYIPSPLRCYKCQKYGHHREACRGHETCGKCGLREPSHTESECPNEAKCPNCLENHPAFSKTCKIYKKEKEITEMKYKENISFPEARKRVNSNKNINTYAEITKNPPQTNQIDYQELLNKLISELTNLIETLKKNQYETNKKQILTYSKTQLNDQNQTQIPKNKKETHQQKPQLNIRERSKSRTRTKTDHKHTVSEEMKTKQENTKPPPKMPNKPKTEILLIEKENKYELIETVSQEEHVKRSKSKSPRPEQKKKTQTQTRDPPSTSNEMEM